MNEMLWTRLKFYVDQVAFCSDLVEAQEYDYSLRAIRVASVEKVEHAGIRYEIVELLVRPDLIAIWRMAVNAQSSLEQVAVHHINARSDAVRSKLPGYIPF